MRFSLDPADRRPIYVQIMDEVRRARALGLFPAEEALPSVRALAAELRLNPNTVAQAYRELERDGVVHVRRGQGTFLTEAAVSADERAAGLRAVAERAVADAERHGFTADELRTAIGEQAGAPAASRRA